MSAFHASSRNRARYFEHMIPKRNECGCPCINHKSARSVSMAVDPEGSFTADVAKRYRELLARDGIKLSLVQSKGAVAP